MKQSDIHWYFDFISPYSYLQLMKYEDTFNTLKVQPVPVLFAGLLNHWGQKGNAEIPAKRIFTYRQAVWLGRKNNTPLRIPSAHPFNPLKALRLAIAVDNDLSTIKQIFAYIWKNGNTPDEQKNWDEFTCGLGITAFDELILQTDSKNKLRENTDAAIARKVFGVPTLYIDGELFWGLDATEMAIDFYQNQELYNDSEMKRIKHIPAAAQR